MQSTQDIQAEANKHYGYRFDDEMRKLIDSVDNYREDYEAAERALQEMPLSFQRLVTYHVREEIEWEILLGTGGPADRVIVKTDFDGNIESAEYQFQDWFQPWTTAENQDSELVERFAQIVGYYEES